MNTIWIIIFIIVMIYRALGKGQGTEQGPKQGKGRWENPGFPPIFNEDRFPEIYYEEPEEEIKRPYSMMPEREPVEDQKVKNDQLSIRSNKLANNRAPFVRRRDMTEASSQIMQINQASLINAVIMSELLQPPLCKRKQKNRF